MPAGTADLTQKGQDLMCSPGSPTEDQQLALACLITSLAGEVCAAFYGT